MNRGDNRLRRVFQGIQQRMQFREVRFAGDNVEKIVDAIFDEITAALARGERIELRGFGTFSVKVHDARTGRNPRTGAPVLVPKKAHPHLKTGKEMNERLNRDEE